MTGSLHQDVRAQQIHYPALPSPLRRLLPVAAVAGLLLTSTTGLRFASTRLADFAGYYTAARIICSEDSLSRLYSDEWFQQKLEELGIHEPTIVMYVNPPTTGLFVLPVSWLPPFTAKLVWAGMTIAACLAACWLLIQAYDIPPRTGYRPLLLLFVTGSLPFLRNLQLGQVYGIVFLIFAAMLFFYVRRNAFAVGSCVAAVLLLKWYGWMFFLLFAAQRRWKELWWSIGWSIAGGALALLWFRPATYVAEFTRIGNIAGAIDTTGPALRSFIAPLSRLFYHDDLLNPGAVAHIPWLPLVFSVVLTAGFLAATLWAFRYRDEAAVPPLLALSVLATPLAADHHYVIMAIPAFVLVTHTDWRTARPVVQILTALLLYALLGWMPIPGSLVGWSGLLMYTRVCAAIVVLVLLLVSSRSSTSERP